MVKKIVRASALGVAALSLAATSVFAVTPGAVVKNPNANANACWGQDRSFYASTHFFPKNQSLNQSFPGDLGEQRAAWVATYCAPHGPTE
jgi:hypothetical protein